MTDGSAGACARTSGIAEALGLDADLEPAGKDDAPSRGGVPGSGAPWPDIAIAAGRGTIPYLKALRRASEGATFTVLLQHPRTEFDAADVVWCLADGQVQATNVIATLTTPHVMRQTQLLALKRPPAPEIAAMGQPIATVLLGGPDAASTFNANVLERLAASVSRFAEADFSFLVLPSPRTTDALLQTVTAATASARRIVWSGGGPNPYWKFLAHADLVIVTGDSVNMTSEACVTGKPVYVLEPGGGPARIEFHSRLRKHGATRPLTPDVDPFATWTYRPLDSAPYIAGEIRRRFKALREATA